MLHWKKAAEDARRKARAAEAKMKSQFQRMSDDLITGKAGSQSVDELYDDGFKECNEALKKVL